jgi:AcrR family transcriptional regulator
MTTHRSYLNTEDRRDTLLDAFGRLLERKSLDSIAMVEVAEEAGISRALLYKHFPDVGSLIQSYFDHRAAMYFELMDLRRTPIERTPAGAMAGIEAISQMPPGELRAIEVLLTNRLHPDLIATRERFRTVFLQRWEGIIANSLDPGLAAHLVWTLVRPFVALAVSVQHREMTLPEAERIWRAMLSGPIELLQLTINPAE